MASFGSSKGAKWLRDGDGRVRSLTPAYGVEGCVEVVDGGCENKMGGGGTGKKGRWGVDISSWKSRTRGSGAGLRPAHNDSRRASSVPLH